SAESSRSGPVRFLRYRWKKLLNKSGITRGQSRVAFSLNLIYAEPGRTIGPDGSGEADGVGPAVHCDLQRAAKSSAALLAAAAPSRAPVFNASGVNSLARVYENTVAKEAPYAVQ